MGDMAVFDDGLPMVAERGAGDEAGRDTLIGLGGPDAIVDFELMLAASNELTILATRPETDACNTAGNAVAVDTGADDLFHLCACSSGDTGLCTPVTSLRKRDGLVGEGGGDVAAGTIGAVVSHRYPCKYIRKCTHSLRAVLRLGRRKRTPVLSEGFRRVRGLRAALYCCDVMLDTISEVLSREGTRDVQRDDAF